MSFCGSFFVNFTLDLCSHKEIISFGAIEEKQ